MLKENIDGSIDGNFFSIFQNFDEENDWFFSINESTDGYNVIDVFQYAGTGGLKNEEIWATGLFRQHRKWDGRNIYYFGDFNRKEDDTLENNSTLYVYNLSSTGLNSDFLDLSGVEHFTEILVKATQVANQILETEQGKNIDNPIKFYSLEDKTIMRHW